MRNSDQITIIIVVRIDTPERQRNLDAVLRYLQFTGIHIYILEADKENHYCTWNFFQNVDFYFTYDEDSVFHRTRYLNQLLRKCTTPVVGVWDADVILPYEQIEDSLDSILNRKGVIVIPYNQTVMYLSEEQTVECLSDDSVLKHLQMHKYAYCSWLGRPSCGGLFLVDRKVYLDCGGENEHFYGWGPEDAERVRRMEILGYSVSTNNQGPLYHLWHPRKKNSYFMDKNQAFMNRLELVKVCSMSADELKEYLLHCQKKISSEPL